MQGMKVAGQTIKGSARMFLRLDLAAACRKSRSAGLSDECRRVYQPGIGEFQHTGWGGGFDDTDRAQEVWRIAVEASPWGPPFEDLRHGGSH